MLFVEFTNGLGNNLFQFIAAKQLALIHKQELVGQCPRGYYGRAPLESLGVKFLDENSDIILDKAYDEIQEVDSHNYQHWFTTSHRPEDLRVKGYFEDYHYYVHNLAEIKSWFPPIVKRGPEDLVLHFRAGDRLLYESTFPYRTPPGEFLQGLAQFEFENLHIVTDMPRWEHYNAKDIEELSVHCSVPQKLRVDPQLSADYFNSFVDGFAHYNPIITQREILEDFNFMRSFDKMMIQHSTLAWWAAVLSDASDVGVYGPWRSWKGKSNKNLSNIGLKGWFQWGG
jgi:hypothetical protein